MAAVLDSLSQMCKEHSIARRARERGPTASKAAQLVDARLRVCIGGREQRHSVVGADGQRCALRCRLGLARDEMQQRQPRLFLPAGCSAQNVLKTRIAGGIFLGPLRWETNLSRLLYNLGSADCRCRWNGAHLWFGVRPRARGILPILAQATWVTCPSAKKRQQAARLPSCSGSHSCRIFSSSCAKYPLCLDLV